MRVCGFLRIYNFLPLSHSKSAFHIQSFNRFTESPAPEDAVSLVFSWKSANFHFECQMCFCFETKPNGDLRLTLKSEFQIWLKIQTFGKMNQTIRKDALSQNKKCSVKTWPRRNCSLKLKLGGSSRIFLWMNRTTQKSSLFSYKMH